MDNLVLLIKLCGRVGIAYMNYYTVSDLYIFILKVKQISVVKFSTIDFMGLNKKNNRLLLLYFFTSFFSKTSSIKNRIWSAFSF